MSRIEIITIGDELVEGRLIDSNAGELSDLLFCEGFAVAQHQSVGDDHDEIVRVLREAVARADAVLVSGGLGPTTDDLTAACAADAFTVPLVRFPEALEHVRAFFAARGRVMSPNNEKQADLPEGSTILPNAAGTAVGFRVISSGCRCYFMPGVPRELHHIFADSVLPDLRSFLQARQCSVATLRIFGRGESEVGHLLHGLGDTLPAGTGFTIQYRAAFPEIHVRLVLTGLGEAEAGSLLDSLAEDARRRLGHHVYAWGRGPVTTTLAEVVAAALQQHSASCAVADACSGGEVLRQLSSLPATGAFVGGVVVPSAGSARQLLGVPAELLDRHGMVSDEVTVAMAEQVARSSAASCGLALTGSADETAGCAAGTIVVAVTGANGSTCRRLQFPIDPPRFRRIAAHAALAVLRRYLTPESRST